MNALAVQLFGESVQDIKSGVGLLPLGQFCHGKAEGIMELGM